MMAMATAVLDHRVTRPRKRWVRDIGGLVAIEAGTVGVVAGLHLSGAISGGSAPFDPDRAGVAEAVIGAVLAAGAFALLRGKARRRAIGLTAVCFAIVGFVVGLIFTTQGGDPFDVAYHAVMLPVLIATALWLSARKPRAT
jgi:hypothetical protein